MFSLKLAVKQLKLLKVNKTNYRNLQSLNIKEGAILSTVQIRNALKQKQYIFEEGFTNFTIPCSFCPKRDKTKTKIFINKKTGALTCETCKHTGSWADLQKYMNADGGGNQKDPLILEELKKLSNSLKNMKTTSITAEEITFEDFLKFSESFKLPDFITLDLLKTHKVRIDINKTALYVPLYNSAFELVGYKKFKSGFVEGSIYPNLKYTQSTGVILFRGVSKSNTAAVVASITEFLALSEKEHVTNNIICLPNGLANLSLHILPCFERYNKLILWFGESLTAWETARNFSKKLVEKRCFFLRSLKKDEDSTFKKTLIQAEPMWHKSIITFSHLREEILSDLHNIDKVQGIKWTRYPTLNKILKGHRRGELTVITGPTGSGKTTFISEYSLDLAMQGANTLWGSFEIRNARLARTMLQQMAGIPLDEHLDQYDHWADQFETLPIYYMTFHGQQSIKVVMEAVEHATYVYDINHVIIDNLQFMMGMSDDQRNIDRFYKQDLIVANFRTFATRRNVHVSLVIHPRKEKDSEDLTTSSIFGGAKASQEADNILIIQDRRLDSIRGKKFLQISKNRYSGDLGVMALDFDKNSLSFAPKKRKSDSKPSDKLPEKSVDNVVY